MAKNQSQAPLTERLGQAAGNTPAQAPASPANTIAAYLKKMEGEISRALPKHMTPERLSRIALTTIRTNPKLLECNIPSLMAAVIQSAQLGLEPGLLGHCYFVPYGKEATFIIGYKGMIDLARRSGQIEQIRAREVYENDYLEVIYGMDEKIVHIPWFNRKDQKFEDGGQFIGCTFIAKFKDGGFHVDFMPKAKIEEKRKRSRAANNGPWVTDYIEMAKKTVVRENWKWLPISVEVASAASVDEATHQDISDVTDEPVIDITASTRVTEETTAASEQQSPEQEEVQFE